MEWKKPKLFVVVGSGSIPLPFFIQHSYKGRLPFLSLFVFLCVEGRGFSYISLQWCENGAFSTDKKLNLLQGFLLLGDPI